jgi:hypothetical protein
MQGFKEALLELCVKIDLSGFIYDLNNFKLIESFVFKTKENWEDGYKGGVEEPIFLFFSRY